MQLSGTSLFTFSLLFRGKVSAPALLGLIVCVAVPLAVQAAVRRTAATSFMPKEDTLTFHAYVTWRRKIPWVRSGSALAARAWQLLGPSGKWGPSEVTQIYGGVVSRTRATWKVFALAPALQTLLFSILAAMPVAPGRLCTAQYALLAIAALAVPLTSVIVRPYRVAVVGWFRLASAAGLTVALGANAYLADEGHDVSATALAALGAGATVVSAVALAQTVHDVLLKVVERVYLQGDGNSVPFLESRSDAASLGTRWLAADRQTLKDVMPHLVALDGSNANGDEEMR
jgi:hypothetical protein